MITLPQIFSQQDPRWAGQRLGTVDGITIGGYGCYITCFSMLAGLFGHNINPGELDDMFTNNGWYVNGNLLTDDDLSKAFPDIKFQQVVDYANSPADLGKLQQLLSESSTAVILEVDFNPEQQGLQTHFVVAVECDGETVTIADPWTGTIRTGAPYGDWKTAIQKFVVYQGVATQPQDNTLNNKKAGKYDNVAYYLYQIHLVDSDNSDLYVDDDTILNALKQLKTDKDSQMGRAGKWDTLCLFLGFAGDSNQVTPDDLETLIKAKDQKVGELNGKVNEYQTDIQTLQGQLVAMGAAVQKIKDEDIRFAKETGDAQHARDALQSQLDTLIKALNAKTYDEAITHATKQEQQHQEVVKQVVPVMNGLADVAFYKRAPKPAQGVLSTVSKLFSWLS